MTALLEPFYQGDAVFTTYIKCPENHSNVSDTYQVIDFESNCPASVWFFMLCFATGNEKELLKYCVRIIDPLIVWASRCFMRSWVSLAICLAFAVSVNKTLLNKVKNGHFQSWIPGISGSHLFYVLYEIAQSTVAKQKLFGPLASLERSVTIWTEKPFQSLNRNIRRHLTFGNVGYDDDFFRNLDFFSLIAS